MSQVTAAEAAHVDAAPELVLEVVRDFRGHHRHILPAAFSDFEVLEGGVGAGTVMRFTTTLGGRAVPGVSVASDPAPNVVREEIRGTDMVTEFRVVPDGATSRVTITTSWTPSGVAERLFAPRMLRAVYRDELALLDRYARELAGMRGAAAAASA